MAIGFMQHPVCRLACSISVDAPLAPDTQEYHPFQDAWDRWRSQQRASAAPIQSRTTLSLFPLLQQRPLLSLTHASVLSDSSNPGPPVGPAAHRHLQPRRGRSRLRPAAAGRPLQLVTQHLRHRGRAQQPGLHPVRFAVQEHRQIACHSDKIGGRGRTCPRPARDSSQENNVRLFELSNIVLSQADA